MTNQEAQQAPLVSVIIPTFNRPEELRNAVQSAAKQTLKSLEIIVVNDGGCDVGDTIKEINDSRLIYICHDHNKGLSAARNTGIRRARGRYLSFLDDDDVFYEQHLQTLVQCMEERTESVVYSDSLELTQEYIGSELVTHSREVRYSRDFNRGWLYINNLAPPLCFLLERELLRDGTCFDESLAAHEDWWFWIQLSKKSSFFHLAEVTCEYINRLDKASLSKNKQDMLDTLIEVYARTEHEIANYPEIPQVRRKLVEILRKNLTNALHSPAHNDETV
jgi:glycosyltransferase involved in cell wall biosynthesis